MTARGASQTEPSTVALRPPDQVMRLERMGSSFPTRLSFMRSVIRALSREKALVERTQWQLDNEGYGYAVYQVALGGYQYSLVALSTRLAPDQRTDRVIAEAWDTSYVLFDGVPDANDIARLAANAPLQEAGRFSERDLILSRANKSVRLFEHVADRLSRGEQPEFGPNSIHRLSHADNRCLREWKIRHRGQRAHCRAAGFGRAVLRGNDACLADPWLHA